MVKEIKIPDIAENVDTGLIASILVSEGDEVSAEQPLLEVETDKATTEIPSEYDGKIKEIKVHEGEQIKVNQVVMLLEVSSEEDDSDNKAENEKQASNSKQPTDNGKSKKKEEEPTDETGKETDDTTEDKHHSEEEKPIRVSPLARKIAREHEVNLSDIEGSGPSNRISRSDVEAFVEAKRQGSNNQSDNAKDADTQNAAKEKLNHVNLITAKTLQEAWQTIPHVTQFDEADITDLENFRNQHQNKIEKQGGKLTVTALLLKIAAFALQKFPRFNASLNWEKKEIFYKHEYNIGVAVDTPNGLLVPVVQHVNRKSLSELSAELTELAKKARNKKISSEEMQGGTFTISNLGGIGGTGFTPIVYPPQVAILGVSRAKYQQVYRNEEFQKRLVLPLSVSYDHRVINGADGARFLRWICNVSEDPYALLF